MAPVEEWVELKKFERRWGSAPFDRYVDQQIVLTEFNVFLGLRQKQFLSPRLHRILCCLPTFQPEVYRLAEEQASVHALLNAVAVYKPVTVFITDVPKSLEAKLYLLKRSREMRELIDTQIRELTSFVLSLLNGVKEEPLYCVAQRFKRSPSGSFVAYKLLRVTQNREKALREAVKSRIETERITYVLEVTGDHDLLFTRIKGDETQIQEEEDDYRSDLKYRVYDALHRIEVELKTFRPNFERCDKLLAFAQAAIKESPEAAALFGEKYEKLKQEVAYRKEGFATRGDIKRIQNLLQKILSKLDKGKV